MHRTFFCQLSPLLTVSLFAGSLPAAANSVNCGQNLANRHYYTNGSDGRSGRDGRSGQDQTVFADAPVNLDLSGKDGEDGEDGDRGTSSECDETRSGNVNENITAPSGGSGGSGGKGGNGGSGGSLTVFYTNLADLKKIAVRAGGGQGGRGGRGASGGRGCRCRVRSWERETCTGTSCTKKRYECKDGDNGSRGSNGSDGKDGTLGTLSIVKGKEPLAADNPTQTMAISQLTKPLNLSKNKWNLRTGAVSLLAPGSIISDEYREFEQRQEGAFQLVWQDKQSISNFTNQVATVSLNEQKQIDVIFPSDLWVDGSTNTEGNLTKLTIKNAIAQKEVTRLAVGNFADSGQNLNLQIVDLGAKSDVINTQFRVKYQVQGGDDFSRFSNSQKLYEGDIPAELVKREYNHFILSLGKLAIPAQGLRPGVNVDIEVVATRSLGGRQVLQTVRWQGVIRRSR
jgi:hypothetical protein